jgi:membrane protease YdiL (CAAX protease family)
MVWRLLLFIAAFILAGYRIWTLRKQKVPFSRALGIGLDRTAIADILVGTAITAFAMSVIFLIEWAAGMLIIEGFASPFALVDDLISFIMIPLIEEFVDRCCILGGLLIIFRRTSAAIAVSALLFGILHGFNENASALSILSHSLGGVMYGIAFVGTNRIWLPFGLHFGWNYTMARVFGFSISGGPPARAPFMRQHDAGSAMLTGGAYGPEGGLISIILRLLVIAHTVTWIRYKHRKGMEHFSHANMN